MAKSKNKLGAKTAVDAKIQEPLVKEVEPKTKSDTVNLLNTTRYPQRDPYENVMFPRGGVVRGVKMSSWMQCQVDGGVLKVVD